MKNYLLILPIVIFFNGCYPKGFFVYEKIPEDIDCYRFKEYVEINNCDRKKQIILKEKISKVIEKIHNQKN